MIDNGLVLYRIIDGEPTPLDYAINEHSYYGIHIEKWLRKNGMGLGQEITDIEASISPNGVMELQIEVSSSFFENMESVYYYIQPAKMFFKP